MPTHFDEEALSKTLRDIPLFGLLDVTQMSRILQACEQRDVQPGTILCQAQTTDEQFLIILTGKVRLESVEGNKLGEITPIRVLGEMGVLTDQQRSSRAVVEEASTVLTLGKVDLEKLVEEDPEMEPSLLIGLTQLLYERMHAMNEEIETMRKQIDFLRKRLEECAPKEPLPVDLFPPDVMDA